MAMLHPDEYVYYNAFIGGVHGAQGIFKLDYWANSYAEAVQGLEDYLRAEYGADFMDHDFTVAVCGPPISAAYYFPSNFIFTPNRETAQFFIAFTKDNCNSALPGKEIYRVERMGTLLSVVLDRRDILAQAPERRSSPAGSSVGRSWSAANMSGLRQSRSACGGSEACTPICSRPGGRRQRRCAMRSCSTRAAAPADF